MSGITRYFQVYGCCYHIAYWIHTMKGMLHECYSEDQLEEQMLAG